MKRAIARALTVLSIAVASSLSGRVVRGQTVAVAAGTWANASFPVENFQAYTSPFGYRQFQGRWQLHRGLDLAAPFGSVVRNWWGGTVVGLSNDRFCGTMVRIRSGRWEHVYCHLQGRVETLNGRKTLRDRGGSVLTMGQTLPTGGIIGRVGMTGRTTGPHLHWGLTYDGKLIDPATVLRAMHSR